LIRRYVLNGAGYIRNVSANQIIEELPKLTASERRAVQAKLVELTSINSPVELHDRGIDKPQAADLRSRLKTFAGDWDHPEVAIYDQDPAR
jgi:hypothetical protein